MIGPMPCGMVRKLVFNRLARRSEKRTSPPPAALIFMGDLEGLQMEIKGQVNINRALSVRTAQELGDALHELDIQRAGIFIEQAMLAGDRENAEYWAKQQATMIGYRSPAQVERMKQRGGLRDGA